MPVDKYALWSKNSCFRGDEKMHYYSKIEKWSNLYACQIGLGGSYRYTFNNIKLTYIVHHDFYVVKDGVCSGSGGAIYRRCITDSDYNDKIAT